MPVSICVYNKNYNIQILKINYHNSPRIDKKIPKLSNNILANVRKPGKSLCCIVCVCEIIINIMTKNVSLNSIFWITMDSKINKIVILDSE